MEKIQEAGCNILNFTWYDCFGVQLNEGDDIVIAIKDHGRISMYSGIIHELNNERVTISYNKWKAGKEVVRKKYYNFPGLMSHLPNIYKIMKHLKYKNN